MLLPVITQRAAMTTHAARAGRRPQSLLFARAPSPGPWGSSGAALGLLQALPPLPAGAQASPSPAGPAFSTDDLRTRPALLILTLNSKSGPRGGCPRLTCSLTHTRSHVLSQCFLFFFTSCLFLCKLYVKEHLPSLD